MHRFLSRADNIGKGSRKMPTLDSIIIRKSNLIWCNKVKFELDPIALLRALAQKESTYGTNNHPRFESSYYYGGSYFVRHVVLLVEEYGKEAASSWSSWQLMFPTAWELGFRGNPQDLQNDEIAIDWIIKYINMRIIDKNPTKLEDIFDAYNSGNFKDRFIPISYVRSCMEYYSNFLKFPIKGEDEA